jgi:hypothetical protein
MNCEQVLEMLSQFHDCELSRADRAGVEIHLGGCPACASELATLAELSEMVRATTEPEAPPDLWGKIARRMGGRGAVRRLGHLRLRSWRAAAAAAILLALVGVGWLSYQSASHRVAPAPVDADNVVDLGPYLDNLTVAATQRRLSPQEAARNIDFPILTAAKLPEGYALKGCCLMECGCCSLCECKYARGSESLLLVQCKNQPVQYGGRSVLETHVRGKPAQVIQCRDRLAVSWESRGTVLHLVGPTDLSELLQLMAEVDERLRAEPGAVQGDLR